MVNEDNLETKFGIRKWKQREGMWSFGMELSHWDRETYLFINFFRWSIAIGFLYVDC